MAIKLATNVLCVKREGRWLLEERGIARRLNYFHLLELTRANPLRFPPTWHDRDELTSKQRDQRDHFVVRGGISHLWDERSGMRPIPTGHARNPFVDDRSDEDAIPDQRALSRPTPRRTEVPSSGVKPITAVSARADEQAQVVSAEAHTDLFVIAPPGTGKTHVLVERITHLVSAGLSKNPFQEILALSFTRAAVGEVRRRLTAKVEAGAHPDVAYARVLTFDSLATRMIALDRDPDFLSARSYEARIELFNDLIETQLPNALDSLSKVRFLFVDEVQDLCGPRATMVLAVARIVKASGGAVCFLGDPAQAIYDFEEPTPASVSSAEFLRDISAGTYASQPPMRISFEQYRRFDTEEMLAFVREARSAMGDDGLHPDGVQVGRLLHDLASKFPPQTLTSFVQLPGRKAILTRTNLEAYQIWRECEKLELHAELWRGSSGQFWPGWIARLVLGFRQEVMPLSLVEARWNDHIGPRVRVIFDQAIAELRKEGVLDDGRLDLIRLNSIVAAGAPMQQRGPASSVVISTIHRSKGLEFDQVMLYKPRDNFGGDAGEVRVIYVAATRARREFRVMEKLSAVKWGAKNGHGLSTQHFHLLRFRDYLLGILVDGADECDISSDVRSLDASRLRQIADRVWERGADEVPRLVDIVPAGTSTPRVTIDGEDLGAISKSLSEDFTRIAKWQKARFEACQGVQLTGVAAKALDINDPFAREAFGVACLAPVPVLSGLGTVITRGS